MENEIISNNMLSRLNNAYQKGREKSILENRIEFQARAVIQHVKFFDLKHINPLDELLQNMSKTTSHRLVA